jgi:hypothetical protein
MGKCTFKNICSHINVHTCINCNCSALKGLLATRKTHTKFLYFSRCLTGALRASLKVQKFCVSLSCGEQTFQCWTITINAGVYIYMKTNIFECTFSHRMYFIFHQCCFAWRFDKYLYYVTTRKRWIEVGVIKTETSVESNCISGFI